MTEHTHTHMTWRDVLSICAKNRRNITYLLNISYVPSTKSNVLCVHCLIRPPSLWSFVGRVMSLLFNTLSRFVIAFLPRSDCLLISWLQSPSTVILEPEKRKSVTTSTFPPSICHAVMGLDAMILVFLIFSLKLALSLSSFTLIKRLFSSSSLSAIRVVSSIYPRLLMFLPPILIPACNSSSPTFLMMCSACRLNKQGDTRHPFCTLFSILNQSVVPYRVLTVASWPAYRRQVRWSWQESNDKPRQCVEKQRHYSANKGPYSQGYGLPGGHVRL